MGLDAAAQHELAERLGEVCEDGFVIEPELVTLAVEDVERFLRCAEALDLSVDFILGGGLTETGKKKWRENYAGTGDAVEMVGRAISLTEGMIAT